MKVTERTVCKQITRWTSCLVLLLVLSASVALPARAAEDAAPSDNEIAAAIDTELLVDEAVPAHRIDVAVTQGEATLTGTVDNLLAKDCASQEAGNVKGVRKVVNRIKLNPPKRKDREIRDDVLEALREDPAADAYELDVRVKNAKVTLEGAVDSHTEKMLCEEVVKGVKGIKSLDSEIIVQDKATRPDGELKAEIEGALESAARVDSDDIEVRVRAGQVRLVGTVRSAAEKVLARETAWVSGVHLVDHSLLTVRKTAPAAAEEEEEATPVPAPELEQSVKDAMQLNPRVWSFDVQVEAYRGTVTLTGVVRNAKAKQVAGQIAADTAGVWRVKNRLKVRPVAHVRDAQVRRGVENALERDPYLAYQDIRVTCRNSEVSLYGTVDTSFEKNHAQDVAFGVKGVVEVRNNLVVRDTWERKSDRAIKEDILEQLKWSPYVHSNDIDVHVRDGVATLTGAVDTLQQYREVTENAYEGGAKVVQNNVRALTVPLGYAY